MCARAAYCTFTSTSHDVVIKPDALPKLNTTLDIGGFYWRIGPMATALLILGKLP